MLPLAPLQQQERMHCIPDCHTRCQGDCILPLSLLAILSLRVLFLAFFAQRTVGWIYKKEYKVLVYSP